MKKFAQRNDMWSISKKKYVPVEEPFYIKDSLF